VPSSGIGEAVARAYAAAGARGVVVADLRYSHERLANLAGDIDGLAVTADVGEEADIKDDLRDKRAAKGAARWIAQTRWCLCIAIDRRNHQVPSRVFGAHT